MMPSRVSDPHPLHPLPTRRTEQFSTNPWQESYFQIRVSPFSDFLAGPLCSSFGFPAGPGRHQGVRKNRANSLAKSHQNPAHGGPIGGKTVFCGFALLVFWPSHGILQRKESRRQPLANVVSELLVIRIGCNTTMTCLFFAVSHRVARFRQAE